MPGSDRTRLVYSTTMALHTTNPSHDARLQSRERSWDNRFGSTLTAKHFRDAHRTRGEYFDQPAYFDTWTQKLTRPATVDHSMLNGHRLGGTVCRARRKRAERRLQDWRQRHPDRVDEWDTGVPLGCSIDGVWALRVVKDIALVCAARNNEI